MVVEALLLLTPDETWRLVDGSRQMIESLSTQMAGRGWQVRQQVLDFLHVKNPQKSWGRKIQVEDGERIVAIYGRASMAEWAVRRNVPILFLGGTRGTHAVPLVGVSSSLLVVDAMDQLMSLGHRRIVFPLCGRSDEFKDGMFAITRAAVEKRGGRYMRGYHNPESQYRTPDVLWRLLEKVFARHRPTALLFLDWQEALSAPCFLNSRGLRIPQDVSLVVLSDSASMDWFSPVLCRYRFPQRKMLAEIIRWLERQPVDWPGRKLLGTWVPGDSIGPPPGGWRCGSFHFTGNAGRYSVGRMPPERSVESARPAVGAVPAESINEDLGRRVKTLRGERGWSLDALAAASGVSRSMLSEIERERANPTLSVTFRIACAFGLSLQDLIGSAESAPAIRTIRAADASQVFRKDEHCRIRTLSPLNTEKDVEFYELRLHPGGALRSQAHIDGTREFLTVEKGRVEVRSGPSLESLGKGDSATYRADLAHEIINTGKHEAVLFLVVIYR